MVKRLFDLLAAGSALILLSPVLLIVAFLVRKRLGSPVLFVQQRPGLHGKPFRMAKFRTMTDARGPDGELLPDADRLPTFGRWLRSTSLDELPELWNVLKGEMSIVGPRPLLMQYLPLYSAEQARRHEVRPGVTGWAQVNGRNALGWDEKFAFDIWYVDNRSLWLDLRIIWMTVTKVLHRDGVSAAGEATMSPFNGSKATHEGKRSMVLIGIYGSSGFGREILPVLREQNAGQDVELVFIDDGAMGEANGRPIYSFQQFIDRDVADKSVVIAIADASVRQKLAEKCAASGFGFSKVQAANVVIGDQVEMAEGSIMCPFTHITSNVRVGRQFHANIYSYIGHDCVIGDFVTFAPGVKCNGNVVIEDGAYIGTGAILKQGTPAKPLRIGAGAVVGMGAVVTKDVPAGVTVVGNPARVMER